jgi:hypothetical protein
MIDFNKEPDYVTDGPNGTIKWFNDIEITEYAKSKSLKCNCFITIHPDGYKERVIIQNNKIVYAKASSLEDIACFIDLMKFVKGSTKRKII